MASPSVQLSLAKVGAWEEAASAGDEVVVEAAETSVVAVEVHVVALAVPEVEAREVVQGTSPSSRLQRSGSSVRFSVTPSSPSPIGESLPHARAES